MAPRSGGPGASGTWKTPREITAELVGHFDIRIDVCADADNAVVPVFIDESMDAFRTDWRDVVDATTGDWAISRLVPPDRVWAWMNPPYGDAQLRKWTARAVEMMARGMDTVAFLPLSPDAGWWDAVDEYADEVWPVRGRVFFEERDPVTGLYRVPRGKNCSKHGEPYATCACAATEGSRQGPNFGSAIVLFRGQPPGVVSDAPRWRTYIQPRLRAGAKGKG